MGPAEVNLIYAPQMGEKQPDDVSKYYLESLLELMVNQVIIKNKLLIFIYHKIGVKLILISVLF